jgi:hypothetical protein
LAKLTDYRHVTLPRQNNSTFQRTGTLVIKAFIASLILGIFVALCGQLTSALAAKANEPLSGNAAKRYVKANNIPPRHQWEANYGYCGEVSLISAGLYYGQYVSQYDARAIASKNADQSTEGSQFLLGVNDVYTTAQMHLRTVRWIDSATSGNFLTWVKKEVSSGYPVIIGVFKNTLSFGESNEPGAGDEHYDHIVLVTAVSSKHPFEPGTYHGGDTITFSDHGLWSPTGKPDFIYTSQFRYFGANRQQANSNSHPIYSLPNAGRNFGIAITGIIDHDGQTLPVRLSTDVNYEEPVMSEGASIRPNPQDLTLTVTISGMVPGVSYKLYRYKDFQSVPDAGFNAAAGKAVKTWDIKIKSGSSFSMTENIRSNQIAVYRAVPMTAP